MSASTAEYRIVALTEPHLARTAALLANFWHLPPEKSERRLRWKYLECPLATTSLFYIALSGEKVVGTLGFFPVPFQLNGETVNVLCPGDAFVVPAHRRFGVYTRLFLHGHRELAPCFDFFVSLSANPASAAGLLKIGWRAIAPRREKWRFQSVHVLRYLLRMAAVPLDEEQVVTSAPLIADLYAQIPGYHRVNLHDCCTPHATRDYLCWRYSNPTERYIAIPYYRQGVLSAFAACVVTRRDAFLLDYREKPGAAVLRDVLRHMIRNVPVPRFYFPMQLFSEDEQKILSECGFHDYRALVERLFGRPAVPVLVHPVREKPEARHWLRQGVDMGDATRWLFPEFCNDGR